MTQPTYDLSRLTPAEKRELIALLEEKERRLSRRKLFTYYPDEGPLRRELYQKHLEFFCAGAEHQERLFLAANRVGKTEGAGAYETTLHLTGKYPDWWEGRRFNRPISAWAAGKTNETTRDIIQAKLFGQVTWEGNRKVVTGTGLVPGDDVGDITWKSGVPDFIDTVKIKHASGGWSQLGLKSYEQGRGAFEGTEKHVIWIDEEPPMSVYTECLVRIMTVQGIIMLTFTPLEGMSEVVLSFLPGGQMPGNEASA